MTTLLLTVVGADRTGLIETLAKTIAAAGGNWEESRLARLAGQFAGIVLVTLDEGRREKLLADLAGLERSGLRVTPHVIAPPAGAASRARVRLELTGADRPGIVQRVAKLLVDQGINIEELESSIGSAPMSGEALFRARARLAVPEALDLAALRASLETLGAELMVDLTEEVASGSRDPASRVI